MAKKLYYEEIEEGKSEALPAAEGINAERDAFAELKAAAEGIERVRFKLVRTDGGSLGTVLLILLGIVVAGSIFIGVGNSGAGKIAVCAIVIAATVAAVAVMIASKVSARAPHYCYYVRDSRGTFCFSETGDTATVVFGGKAYRIEGESFYTLDERAYSEWLEGEGTGLVAALYAERGDFTVTDDVLTLECKEGASHEFFLAEGEIVRIDSAQPVATDVVDVRTGKAKLKYRTYTKTEPTYDFVWEIPPFVRRAFEDNGEPFPVLP